MENYLYSTATEDHDVARMVHEPLRRHGKRQAATASGIAKSWSWGWSWTRVLFFLSIVVGYEDYSNYSYKHHEEEEKEDQGYARLHKDCAVLKIYR